jgi:hypothetical protein
MVASHVSRNMHTSTDGDTVDENVTLLPPFARLSQYSDTSCIQWVLVYLPTLLKRLNMAIKGPQGKQDAQRKFSLRKT